MKVSTIDGATHEVVAPVKKTPQIKVANYSNEDSTIKNLTKETFAYAEFTNNDRTVCKIYWNNPDGHGNVDKELDHFTVNLEDKTSDGKEHPYITKLFELTTLDEMHENTWNRMKGQQKMWREFAIKIAKQDGLIIDPVAYYDSDTQSAKLDTKFFGQTLKLLFDDFDTEKQKEDLFIIKLAAFELDMVKSSNDRERKTKLRKAKTPLEVLNVLIEMKEISEVPV
tara:strand:- start:5054 stop:5728 length:675 start_codon:yes stop_codon:yes gene_type:complete